MLTFTSWPTSHKVDQCLTKYPSHFHNRKVEEKKKQFANILDFDLQFHPVARILQTNVMEWKLTLKDTYGPNMNAFW